MYSNREAPLPVPESKYSTDLSESSASESTQSENLPKSQGQRFNGTEVESLMARVDDEVETLIRDSGKAKDLKIQSDENAFVEKNLNKFKEDSYRDEDGNLIEAWHNSEGYSISKEGNYYEVSDVDGNIIDDYSSNLKSAKIEALKHLWREKYFDELDYTFDTPLNNAAPHQKNFLKFKDTAEKLGLTIFDISEAAGGSRYTKNIKFSRIIDRLHSCVRSQRQ